MHLALNLQAHVTLLNPELLPTLNNVHLSVSFLINGSKKITFLNGGFPVTFLGRVNALPWPKIQPTFVMMVAATAQAGSYLNGSNTKGEMPLGLVPLDKKFEDWLITRFRQIEKEWE